MCSSGSNIDSQPCPSCLPVVFGRDKCFAVGRSAKTMPKESQGIPSLSETSDSMAAPP